MVGTKINPKVMDKGELNSLHKNNSPDQCMKGELNDWYKSNWPNGWVERKSVGRHGDNLLDRKAVAGQMKMVSTEITDDTEEQGPGFLLEKNLRGEKSIDYCF